MCCDEDLFLKTLAFSVVVMHFLWTAFRGTSQGRTIRYRRRQHRNVSQSPSPIHLPFTVHSGGWVMWANVCHQWNDRREILSLFYRRAVFSHFQIPFLTVDNFTSNLKKGTSIFHYWSVSKVFIFNTAK